MNPNQGLDSRWLNQQVEAGILRPANPDPAALRDWAQAIRGIPAELRKELIDPTAAMVREAEAVLLIAVFVWAAVRLLIAWKKP